MKNAYGRAAKLAADYAKNRSDIREVSKKVSVLTDWKREDRGVSLDDVRTEYLEDGDRWRGWQHAIEHVQGCRDPDDDEPISDEQRELAMLLDRKAALRVEAGKIKRGIVAAGRCLQDVPF
ncbi:hypothetical protein [Pseudomonas viridiflava]|uniref:hypothetical protein n=1 Tax=Pseudomonas viridiflava TaxID=33069 RepID=UPI001C31C081|nr:hypothetical protein [Pseudomonas viridiflava]QXG34010.1 hypothetical protein KTT61_18210 [Pseudomonas viridiflava]